MEFPERIHNIGETEFWDQLRVLREDVAADELASAIELGLAGRKEEAYAALASFHRQARTQSWEMAREKLAETAPLTAEEIAEIVGDATLEEAGLHAITGKVTPLINHMIRSGEAEEGWRSFLAGVLTTCYRRRRELAEMPPYELNTQLPAHGQFHFFWHIYLVLARTGEVPTDAAEAAMKLILGLGRAMHQKSVRHIVHNIYTAGCFGLLFLARTMREIRESEEWDRLAVKQLDFDFDQSFFPDGGHLERNWGYGGHTIWRLGLAYHFAMQTGGLHGCEAHFLEGLRRAYRFYSCTCGPREIYPGFGDAGLCEPGDIFNQAQRAKVFPPDTPRHFGIDRGKSYLMDGARVAIMRNGAGEGAAYVNITYGDFAGWHSHHDLLSMNLRAEGEILLEEAPRFGPYAHPMDLIWRQPEAHNQLLVDGFPYDSRPVAGEDPFWYSDETVDYFSACHRAYRAVAQNEHRDYLASANLIVRRTIVFVKDPGYALVLDSVRPEGGDNFNRATSCWWHSPHGFSAIGPGLARTNGPAACLLAFARPESLRRLELGVDFSPEECTDEHRISLYDEWRHLRVRTWMPTDFEGCLGFATLLYPFTGEPPDATIEPTPIAGELRHRAEAFRLRTPAGEDAIALNPELLPDVAVDGRAIISLGASRQQIRIG